MFGVRFEQGLRCRPGVSGLSSYRTLLFGLGFWCEARARFWSSRLWRFGRCRGIPGGSEVRLRRKDSAGFCGGSEARFRKVQRSKVGDVT